MAEYLSPGVYVEEFESGLRPMEGVSTSTAGFVGMAEKGVVIGTPEFVTSFADYKRKFGGYLSANTYGSYRFLPYAVEQFFANGGARCYVMRVAPSTAKQATAQFGSIVLSASNPGKWGNDIKITVTATSKAKSQIIDVVDDVASATKIYTLKNAAGFMAGDYVVFKNGTKAVIYNKIVKVQDNTVTFANEFDGDVVDKNIVSKKILSTCEINVEVACDDIYEMYEQVSFNIQASSFIEKALAKSALISTEAVISSEILTPMLAFSEVPETEKVVFTLSGGSDGNLSNIDADVFIGTDNGPGNRTGLNAFLEVTNVSIMAIPGVTIPAVELELVSHCSRLKSRFAVLDAPKNCVKPSDVLAFREKIDSDYAAMYHPWLEVFDPLDKKSLHIPPSGAICGIYARSDIQRGVHKAPANEVVNNCLGLSSLYNKAEQDVLNPAGVNLIRALPGQGIRVWGGRTCSSNKLWKYVNVRRLFIYLEETIKSETNWAVFEPNDEMLWTRVGRTIKSFLREMYRGGALVGASEEQAFFVNIGRDTMSQDDILNGRLICVIGVAPSRPAEFVIFRITQTMEE